MEKRTLSMRVIIAKFAAKGVTVGSAESCTGGMVAKLLTDASGSSVVFRGGFVTYTNDLKEALLGVDPALIAEHTEVSHACAKAMAEGVRKRLGTTYALSTTGYAGPGGGTPAKPVGTVYVAISTERGETVRKLSLSAMRSREYIRIVSANHVYDLIMKET